MQTRKHCCRNKIASRTRENYFWKLSRKRSLLQRRRFCVFSICCVGAQARNSKHLRNTEEPLTLNNSESALFSSLHTHATYFKDVESASHKQKILCFLPVCSPMQRCEQHRPLMFPQQCFENIGNISTMQRSMSSIFELHLNWCISEQSTLLNLNRVKIYLEHACFIDHQSQLWI